MLQDQDLKCQDQDQDGRILERSWDTTQFRGLPDWS